MNLLIKYLPWYFQLMKPHIGFLPFSDIFCVNLIVFTRFVFFLVLKKNLKSMLHFFQIFYPHVNSATYYFLILIIPDRKLCYEFWSSEKCGELPYSDVF